MNKFKNRRGSALLIVLGMLSFIVVSAVAFATYMRYSRLPSSYLRRTSASRLLVKAALTEAIEQIDAAIGDNPYPGVGEKMSKFPRSANGDGATSNRNYWYDRVFVGTNQEVDSADTISTLNMEALAYIPPPFINDVRYWSRHTESAKWHNLPFDAGRFAFTAIDVSDCFDINRMEADISRDSSDLGRITLTHALEDYPCHRGYAANPTAWDSFMRDYVDPNGNKVPLVSVADLNLALWAKKPSGIKSPFAEYVHKTSDASFNRDGENEPYLAFITESYAGTNDTDAIDISLEKNQPLKGLTAGRGSSDTEDQNDDQIMKILGNNNEFVSNLSGYLSPFSIYQLYDYLDRDSVPLSLALPQVERTPMLTGVSVLPLNLVLALSSPNVKDVADATINPTTGKPTGYTRIKTTTLNLKGRLDVRAGVVFPFKYDRGSTPPKFKAQAAATIALVRNTPADRNNLRLPNAIKPAIFEKRGDWASGNKVEQKQLSNEKVASIVQLFSKTVDLSIPKKIDSEEDAVLADVRLQFDPIDVNFAAQFDPVQAQGYTGTGEENGTFRLVERLDGNKAVVQGSTLFELATQNFRPVKMDLSALDELKEGDAYAPVVQVWVRILDEDDNVVDLVPACVDDDEKPFTQLKAMARGSGIRGALRFYGLPGEGGSDLTINQDALFTNPSATAVKFTPAAYMTDDPRFNYAPENWIMLTEDSESFDKRWLKENTSRDRDGDIFMATSDAGYLQSIYELLFLTDFTGTGRFVSQANYATLGSGFDGRIRTGFQGAPSAAAMWRTFGSTKQSLDEIREMKVISGAKGFRINPNTRDLEIMMAALANTPINWWAASTNNVNDAEKEKLVKKSALDKSRTVLDLDKNVKYTMCSDGDFMRVKHGKVVNGTAEKNTLAELGQRFMQAFAAAGVAGKDWGEAFDELDWDSDDQIAGIDLGITLHSVDRKFLYGYWRECFDNRQQLFLVFVRAEPMMMGGGGMGQTPPQLGGRAVALVWRDPKAPKNSTSGSTPHRTRVLFYRQLD